MDIEKTIKYAQNLDNSPTALDTLYDLLLEQFGLERPNERQYCTKGTLLTFDGHSGAGKDKQIEVLTDHMRRSPRYKAKKIVQITQKNEDPFRKVSKYLWAHPELKQHGDCSFFLLTAGRKYFTYHTLLPLLEDPDTIIVQNRSCLSHIAYPAQREDELPLLLAYAFFDPKPSLPFVLECDSSTALERVIRRSPEKGGKIYPNETPEYTKRVKKNFKHLGDLVEGLIFVNTSDTINKVAETIRSKTYDILTRGCEWKR